MQEVQDLNKVSTSRIPINGHPEQKRSKNLNQISGSKIYSFLIFIYTHQHTKYETLCNPTIEVIQTPVRYWQLGSEEQKACPRLPQKASFDPPGSGLGLGWSLRNWNLAMMYTKMVRLVFGTAEGVKLLAIHQAFASRHAPSSSIFLIYRRYHQLYRPLDHTLRMSREGEDKGVHDRKT